MARDHAVSGSRFPQVCGRAVRDEGRCARKGLRCDRLRHPREPRRAAAAERKVVLPRNPTAALIDAALEQRIRELARAVDVTCDGARIEHTEIREWMEAEAVAAEVAVHDSVRGHDVG